MRVVVIGGGPSGTVAATLLARGGASVTLIEQHSFPRDKVCGECLSSLGLRVLDRHGLSGPMQCIGRTIDAAVLTGPTRTVRLPLPSPMLGITRAAMDAALLAAAAGAGVRVRQPARAEAVDEGTAADADGDVRVRVRDLANNRVMTEAADWCLLADGRAALSSARPKPTGDLGLKAHFKRVAADGDAVTLYGGLGCYGGVAPVEDGTWNVAFSVRREAVAAARGDLEAVWSSLLAGSPAMRSHFRTARRAGDWLAASLPRHAPPVRVTGRVVPIGAAACAIEPVGGEGMGTAIRSAELAAAAVLAGDVSDLAAAYAGLWRRRRPFCRLGGLLMSDPSASEAIGLAATPVVGRMAMWLAGK